MAYLGKSPSQGVRNRYYFTASGGETSISGALTGGTLTFTDGNYVDVNLNGVTLVAGTDYNTSTANTIAGLSALTASDVVEIVVYDVFSVFSGNVNSDFSVGGNLSVTGTTAFTGATTITGLTTTGDINFGDNDKAIFGAGSDLQIYHDGSNSYIDDAGAGDLFIRASNNHYLRFMNGDYAITTSENGDVGLRYDNSQKLVTTSTGIDITGGFTATAASTITTADNTVQLTLKSTDADANVGPILDMIRDSGSPADGDEIGRFRFIGDDDGGNATTYAFMQVKINDATDASDDGELEILTRTNGSNRSRIELLPTETVFNEDSQDIDFRVESNDNANCFYVDAGNDHVLFGKTATNSDNAGFEVLSNGSIAATRSGGHAGLFNRLSDTGAILNLRKDGANIGLIGTLSDRMYVGSSATGLSFEGSQGDSIYPISASGGGSLRDNAIDLGFASARFDDIHATNGTIQTSDENEKQNIAALTSAEITAAKAISALFKTFKWKSKVTAKGDAARTHTGVIAQEVQAAMSAAGLDATKYAFWCSDTWWETTTEVAAVEADKDADIEAQDAHTRINTYKTEDAAPEGATKRTRLGVRYPELLAFVGAATEQRLADIETRLAALEAE
jgi:hypothetical protein